MDLWPFDDKVANDRWQEANLYLTWKQELDGKCFLQVENKPGACFEIRDKYLSDNQYSALRINTVRGKGILDPKSWSLDATERFYESGYKSDN